MRRVFAALVVLLVALPSLAKEKPNILIITVDDMSCDSVGVYGCQLKDTSPNMDALAARGLRFEYAHVQVGNCMPGRNVMWSGRYPHNNRVEGFYQIKDPDYPVLCDLMKEAGYFTAIRGKVTHSTPYHPYAWDADVTTLDGVKQHMKDAASFGRSTTTAIELAAKAGKPFCLMVNISDPHKPFYIHGSGDKHVPSRVFKPNEVPVPGFLFDDPAVRKELAHYYSSVRRGDDCVGAVLKALDKSGKADETMIVFLSDHGMPLPFAKTQLYHHSTRTPLMVVWPGVTKPGTLDKQHMVSAVDFLPTLLDVAGAEHPKGLDGRSFASVIRGQKQADRDYVVKEYAENSGGSRDPMRAVQSKQYLYLFNPWSNGSRVFATATTGTQTYRRMAEFAKKDPKLAARHEIYQHRVPEEFYDVSKDPDCLHNLIDDPSVQEELAQARQRLAAWMAKSGDPLRETFANREDAAAREAFVQKQEAESAQRRANRRKRNREGKNKKQDKSK